MFSRIVISVLILAIIACPLRCGKGSCLACQCDSMAKSADYVCPDPGTASCCCPSKSSDNDDDHAPRPCSDKSCQGVCGGAVIQKPVELDGKDNSMSLPLIEANASITFQLTEAGSLDFVLQGRSGCGNHGRFLRTLHMSFLC